MASGAESTPAKLAAVGGCITDSIAVSIGVPSGAIARSLVSATLHTRASGTYEFLTGSAGQALKAATSGKAIAADSWNSLSDLRNAIPGQASTAADNALNDIKTIINDTENLRDPVANPPPWGSNASRAFETFSEDTLPAYETAFKWLGRASKVLGWAGIALTGLAAGADYYVHDTNDPLAIRITRSILVGATHAAFTAAGAFVGGAVGGAIGGFCGPLAVVCSPALAVIGASAGAAGGDWLAGKAVDLEDNLASNVANALTNWWNSL